MYDRFPKLDFYKEAACIFENVGCAYCNNIILLLKCYTLALDKRGYSDNYFFFFYFCIKTYTCIIGTH